MNTAVHFSSAKDEWSTPQPFFDKLDSEFNFGWDLSATKENTKVLGKFFSAEDSAFNYGWSANVGVYWCNPPYSLSAPFIAKASHDTKEFGSTVVMLLPARTDTKAFHGYIWDHEQHATRRGVEVRFIKGRLKFGGSANSAPFPSMVVIFRPQ